MKNITKIAALLLISTALSGCFWTGSTPNTLVGGGMGGATGSGGGGSTGGAGGGATGGGTGGGAGGAGGGTGGGAVTVASTTPNAVVRKYTINTQIDFADPTNPITTYKVDDRSKSGGQVMKVGETAGDGTWQLDPSKNPGETLENGTKFISASAPRTSTDKELAMGGDRSTYSKASIASSQNLSIVDFQYARSGVSILTDLPGGSSPNVEIYSSAFYGAKDDSVARPANLSGSATYNGRAGATVITSQGVSAAEGDLTLNVGFSGGGGTVDGSVNNIKMTYQDGSSANADFNVLLQNGTITGADYKGKVDLQNSATQQSIVNMSGADGRGEFHGGFYGPNGEETAGALDITGTANNAQLKANGQVDIFGTFVGKK